MNWKPIWPDGKRFAFTVFDDTDLVHKVDDVAPVYSMLFDLGFRTTKSVWPLRGDGKPRAGGLTCEDAAHVTWLLELQKQGFEIGYHNSTFHTSDREQTRHGLDRFKELFGADPSAMANHTGCHEGIYWGEYRLEGANRLLYNLLTRFKRKNEFRGHLPEDPLFWGDLCRERIRYVRNFVFADINTLKRCPIMPYHDPQKPYVQDWFASSEGPAVASFNKCITEAAQDRLEEGRRVHHVRALRLRLRRQRPTRSAI